MKHSELKEMIRRAVRERALTKAEKKKKEDIVKGMKKSFKGDEASMYAIATAKAKKIAEATGSPAIHDLLDRVANDWGKDSDLYNDLEDTIVSWSDTNGNLNPKGKEAIKALLSNYDVQEDYGWILDPKPADHTGETTSMYEVQGTELTQKIFDIGATLKKVEAAMDFGMDQDPKVIEGLDQAYAELINILNLIERDREERRFVDENMINEGGDHEVAMAQNSLKSIAKATIELNQKLGNQERNIPGWIQDHIAKAENYIEQAAQGFHELSEEKHSLNEVEVGDKLKHKLTGAEMVVTKVSGNNITSKITAVGTLKGAKVGDINKTSALLIGKTYDLNEEKDPLDVVVAEKKAKDLNEITAAQLKYAVNKPKQSDFRKQIIAAKKMFDAGATEKEVRAKFSQEVINAVNSEASLDDISEKKGKDLTGPSGKPDGKIDSADYLKARDIAIKQAIAKKK